MKPYLFTATDRNGQSASQAREAQSIEHLRMVLEREGYRDIEFLDDETLATLRQQRAPEARPQTAAQFRFEAELRKGRTRQQVLLFALRSSWPYLLAAGVLIGFAIVFKRPILGTSAAIGLAFFVWQMFARLRDGDDYDGLLRAYAFGDWERAEKLIDRLERSPTTKGNEQLALDLKFRRAGLLARRGKLDEALAAVEPLRTHARLAQGLFESRRASLFYAAERIPDFVQSMQQAYEASGHAQLQGLDFAFTHARFGDAARARELLAKQKRENLNAMHGRIFDLSDALCAMRAGELGRAEAKANAALRTLADYQNSAPMLSMNAIVAGYGAIVLAKAGKKDAARHALAPWRAAAAVCLDPVAKRQLATLLPD